MTPDRMQKSDVMRWNLAFSAGATAASYALVSPRFAGSLALGALLEVVNFRNLWRHAEAALLARSVRGAAVGAFGLRFVGMAAVLFFALRYGADPVGLLLGLSLIVPAVVLAAWRARPAVDPDAPALDPDDPEWDAWNPWTARERADDDEDSK